MKKNSEKNVRYLLTRLGLVTTTATVTLMGPATPIANALIASNHNEVMLAREDRCSASCVGRGNHGCADDRKVQIKGGAKVRYVLTRLGLVTTTATVTLMGPATAIAEARLASNHNEVLATR